MLFRSDFGEIDDFKNLHHGDENVFTANKLNFNLVGVGFLFDSFAYFANYCEPNSSL